MNNELRIIPFSEVAVGQEFESWFRTEISGDPWVKRSDTSYESLRIIHNGGVDCFRKGCLVRVADCDPPKHCWEGGTKATCDCPDCGPCLVDYTETPEERKAADCEPELVTTNLDEALSIISNRCDLDQYEGDLVELVRLAKIELEAQKQTKRS
jgi:hypothetical protein